MRITIPSLARLGGLSLCLAAALTLAAIIPSGCGKKERNFYASGTFEAVEVDLAGLVTGRLLRLDKREGARVEKGELLAEIDCEKQQLERELTQVQLEAADLELVLLNKSVEANRISLKNNEKNLERFEQLKSQKSATEQNVDDHDTAVKLERTRLEASLKELARPAIRRRELETQMLLLERNITDSRVYSPLDGQVLARFAEPGEVVAAGRSLLRVADLSLLNIRVYLPAALLGKVKLDQAVNLRADGAPDSSLTGRVVWISPLAEFTPKTVQTPEARAELVYAVKIEVSNPAGLLKIGMPADVYFPEGD